MKLLNRFFEKLEKSVLDDNLRYELQYLGTYLILGIVSLFMTVVNIFTGEYYLMISTGVFAVLSLLNVFLMRINTTLYSLTKALFSVEVVLLIAFFIINGDPHGFSAIWGAMIPALGLLLLGRERGSILSGIVLLIILFLFWTPFGKEILLHPEFYSEAFMLRFPFLYIAFFFVGYLFETIRHLTFKNYRKAITHDPMTNALNRKGLDEYLINSCANVNEVGFMIFDIDHFKTINDTYGHKLGDQVLIEIVQIFEEIFKYPLCRWGGDEFVALIPDGDINEDDLDRIMDAIRTHDFVYDNQTINCTISLGAVITNCDNGINFTNLCYEADKCLYEIKNTTRNGYKLRKV